MSVQNGRHYLTEGGWKHRRLNGGARARHRLRRSTFRRDDYTCQGCGYRPPEWQLTLAAEYGSAAFGELTLDHIIPYSQGGGWTVDNLRTLCKNCNNRRGNQPLEGLES